MIIVRIIGQPLALGPVQQAPLESSQSSRSTALLAESCQSATRIICNYHMERTKHPLLSNISLLPQKGT